jgi:hypothetical protein
MRRAGRGVVRLVAVAALLTLPARGRAQGVVHAARFSADLTGAAAEVRVTYELRGVAAGDSVDVAALDVGDAAVGALRAGAAGAPVPFAPVFGARRAARVPVSGGPDGSLRLELAYTVPIPSGGPSLVAHLPVVTVDLAPERARAELFRAELRVPPSWTVTEGFPTTMRAGREAGTQAASLQVVPALVTVRASTGGGTRLGLVQLLDAIAVVALLAFGAAGWRALARPPA